MSWASENLGGLFDGPKPEAPEEMGVAFAAKEIDGKLYLPATEVVKLLEVNDVLPKMRAALERRLA